MSEWRCVPGYEGLYEVSDEGAVRSMTRHARMPRGGFRVSPGRVLRAAAGSAGYLQVCLARDGAKATHHVHRLVAAAFLSATWFPGAQVCHNDGDRRNNHVSNLRWGSLSDNIQDCVKHGTHWQARKTHCPKGHAYDRANTRVTHSVTGRARVCRQCHRDEVRAAAQRRRLQQAFAAGGAE